MARNPISLSAQDDEGEGLLVRFSKQDFSDFIFSLVSTPRQESKAFTLGFDLSKEKLKSIIDKLNYQISTHNDVLNIDFVAQVRFESGHELTLSNYEQLFNEDVIRPETISDISLAVSYVIGFTRREFEESKKSYEKQTVFLYFVAGPVGKVHVSIRSTDLMWPRCSVPASGGSGLGSGLTTNR